MGPNAQAGLRALEDEEKPPKEVPPRHGHDMGIGHKARETLQLDTPHDTEIRILAIDPRASVAEAYGHRLSDEPGFVFLGVLIDPNATYEAVARLRPNVSLVNLLLRSGQNGTRVLKDIARAYPLCRRLVIADFESCGSALVADALNCEPEGFFSVEEGLKELVEAVHVVAAGDRRFLPEFETVAEHAHDVLNLFSKGERRVVCALAQHGNKEEAAESTYYSTETVNTYVRRIRKRVAEFEGRDSFRLPDLIAWARRHGFHRIDFAT